MHTLVERVSVWSAVWLSVTMSASSCGDNEAVDAAVLEEDAAISAAEASGDAGALGVVESSRDVTTLLASDAATNSESTSSDSTSSDSTSSEGTSVPPVTSDAVVVPSSETSGSEAATSDFGSETRGVLSTDAVSTNDTEALLTSDGPDVEPPLDRWQQGAALFTSDAIAEIHIELPETSVIGLRADGSSYVHGALSVTLADGTHESLLDVGVRLKGRLGSGRSFDEKCAFLVKANEYVKGQRLFGLNKLAINNLVQDPTMLREQLSYDLFRAMDVPAPRTGYARVHVNGELKGLYATIEVVDNPPFLEHWFPNSDGNLYEGEYGSDVETRLVTTFDQDRGDDVAFADLAELAEALDLMTNPETFVDDVATVIDLDAYVAFAATELFLSHWDGYAATRNNYFVYRPQGDLWHWIPWGTDQTFGDVRASVWNGGGRLQRMCEASLACRQKLAVAHGRLIGLVSELNLLRRVDELEQVISDAVAEDSSKEYTTAAVHLAIEQLRGYLRERPSNVATDLRCTDPRNVDEDGDGASGCGEDCNDQDPNVYPGAYEACNLVDDDCSGRVDDANDCPQCAFVTDDAGRDHAFCFARATYAAARAHCQSQGGSLVSVHDDAQHAWLTATISSLRLGSEWWIGLSDSEEEGVFVWDDGSEVDYTHWNTGEPNDWGGNEDCTELTRGIWNDLACNQGLAYICQL